MSNNSSKSKLLLLTVSFFKVDPCQTPTKSRYSTIFGLGICLVPNGYTPAGFTIGALRLETMATLVPPFKNITQNQNFIPQGDFYFLLT